MADLGRIRQVSSRLGWVEREFSDASQFTDSGEAFLGSADLESAMAACVTGWSQQRTALIAQLSNVARLSALAASSGSGRAPRSPRSAPTPPTRSTRCSTTSTSRFPATTRSRSTRGHDGTRKQFEASYTEFNSGAAKMIQGLNGMSQYLNAAAKAFAETDTQLAAALK